MITAKEVEKAIISLLRIEENAYLTWSNLFKEVKHSLNADEPAKATYQKALKNLGNVEDPGRRVLRNPPEGKTKPTYYYLKSRKEKAERKMWDAGILKGDVPSEIRDVHTRDMRTFIDRWIRTISNIEEYPNPMQGFSAQGGIILPLSLTDPVRNPFFHCLKEHESIGKKIRSNWEILQGAIDQSIACDSRLKEGIVSLIESKFELHWMEEYPEINDPFVTTEYICWFYCLIQFMAEEDEERIKEHLSIETFLDERWVGYLCYGTKNSVWVCIKPNDESPEDHKNRLENLRWEIIEEIKKSDLVYQATELINKKNEILDIRNELIANMEELRAYPSIPGTCFLMRRLSPTPPPTSR